MNLKQQLADCLNHVSIAAFRFNIQTDCPSMTVPMLRGVWGAALRFLDRPAFDAVFESEGSPGYVLRPTEPPEQDAVEWILIGSAVERAEVLLRAWDIAGGMGLGKERSLFALQSRACLTHRGHETDGRAPWPLGKAAWPLSGRRESRPCRLLFPYPLRILRYKRLIERPTFPDLAVAAMRRMEAYLPDSEKAAWSALREPVLEEARNISATPWQGTRLDFVRYSGKQKREIEMRGVCGQMDLPEGPGRLWPLLAAAQWTHIGKGTVMGLGRLLIEQL